MYKNLMIWAKCVFQSGRLYSTKFLRVLLRAKVRSFTTWGIELLVGQLYDQSRSVAMTALSILDEACEDHVSISSALQIASLQTKITGPFSPNTDRVGN